jgi:phage baseplate assembly protein W
MPITASIIDNKFSNELGANWRIQLRDADGMPLTMASFEAIDFGAVSYKEIFQNVKTILTTPLFSAALERTLGLDTSIVDLPMNLAEEATVAILDALYYWESRVEVMSIDFEPKTLTGQLTVNLQLKVKNVIWGTSTQYDKITIYTEEPIVPPALPPSKPTDEAPPGMIIQGPPGPEGPQGPPGATGPAGTRGSLWFTGTTDPVSVAGALINDMYLNTTTAAIFQYDGTTWRVIFNGRST